MGMQSRVVLMGNEYGILLTTATAGVVVSILWGVFWVQPRQAYLLAVSDCSVAVQPHLEARGYPDPNGTAWSVCNERFQRRAER